MERMASNQSRKDLKIEWQRTVLAARLGAAATAVALAVSVYADEDGCHADPGVRRLAHGLSLSEATVRRALTDLREIGLLVRSVRGSTAEKRSQADRYDLALPDDLPERVQIQPDPVPVAAGRGRGGMANHMRWHERRGKVVATCVHCVESVAPGSLSESGSDEARTEMPSPDRSSTIETEPLDTALYRYWDDKDNLLYIGISGALANRENSHIKSSSWMQFVARSTVERFPSRAEAKAAEESAIKSEHPLFNSKHNESAEAVGRLVDYLIEHDRRDLLRAAVSRG
jgi:biotin operon repressor